MRELQIRLKDLSTIGVDNERLKGVLLVGSHHEVEDIDGILDYWRTATEVRIEFMNVDGDHIMDYSLPIESIQYMVIIEVVKDA